MNPQKLKLLDIIKKLPVLSQELFIITYRKYSTLTDLEYVIESMNDDQLRVATHKYSKEERPVQVEYTIGILFSQNFEYVALISKLKPDWQKGKLNFPGGKIEENETPYECVSREFKEECDLNSYPFDWSLIGCIEAPDYNCHILTSVIENSNIAASINSLTDEKVEWYQTNHLPDICVSNLHWLVPFAKNFHQQGNKDILKFGTFEYSNL